MSLTTSSIANEILEQATLNELSCIIYDLYGIKFDACDLSLNDHIRIIGMNENDVYNWTDKNNVDLFNNLYTFYIRKGLKLYKDDKADYTSAHITKIHRFMDSLVTDLTHGPSHMCCTEFVDIKNIAYLISTFAEIVIHKSMFVVLHSKQFKEMQCLYSYPGRSREFENFLIERNYIWGRPKWETCYE